MRTRERDIFDDGDGRCCLAEHAVAERARGHQLLLRRDVGRLVDRRSRAPRTAAAARKGDGDGHRDRRSGRAEEHHLGTYWPAVPSGWLGTSPAGLAAPSAGVAPPPSAVSKSWSVCSPVSRLPLTKKLGVDSTPNFSLPRVRVSTILLNSSLSARH